MPTIQDVAKLAGVSASTVSRVLNKSGYVNRKTELKVNQAIETLQYVPNAVARSLTSKKTGTIVLVIPNITNPFFSELSRAVEDTAKQFGYISFLANSDNDREKELTYIRSLKQRYYIEGVIFATQQLGSDDTSELKRMGVPTVLLDWTSEDFPSVRVDYYQGAVMAVQHLLSIGCTKIAHISGPKYRASAFERYKGYVETLEKYDLFNPVYVVEGDYTIKSALQLTDQLLNKHPEIDGIFAANDLLAIGSLKSLLRNGKKVPDEVALIGFDGITMTEAVEPEISTIAQPIYEIGKQAVHQLIKEINGEQREKTDVELEVQLIQRSTTTKTS